MGCAMKLARLMAAQEAAYTTKPMQYMLGLLQI
jgi:hypothetical protein